MLSHIFFGLVHADPVMFRNSVQFGEAVPQLLQLVNLLIAKLLGLLVLLLKLGKLLGQIGQTLCRVLHLLEHVGFTLLNQVVKFFLSTELVYLQLSLEFFLLLNLFLSRLQIAFQVKQKVWLLDHF